MPGRIDVGIEVLLRRLPGAGAITRVVVGKDVAVDAGSQADVEAAHLPQIHGVTVGEQHRVPAETNVSNPYGHTTLSGLGSNRKIKRD